MGTTLPVWLRSTLRVWGHYLAICLASIPAAILATILISNGFSEQAAAFISVPLALALALVGWRLAMEPSLSKKREVSVGMLTYPRLPGTKILNIAHPPFQFWHNVPSRVIRSAGSAPIIIFPLERSVVASWTSR